MAGHQDLLNGEGGLFDVPLPDDGPARPARPAGHSPTTTSSALGFSNRAFADDVGFEDELPEQTSLGGPTTVYSDYGSVSRAPIPVPTISQGMVPYSGMHLLAGVEAVEIQQTVELTDLLASVESENRYVVRSPVTGDTLLVAAETSSPYQRQFVGSSRGLRMRVYDPSRQEALHLSRRLACGAGPCGLLGCCCYLQRVDVVLPPGRPLGSVVQTWSMFVPVLNVEDVVGTVLYRIEGPSVAPWVCTIKEAVFKITSRDGLVELGSISHHWKSTQSTYTTVVIFPSAELSIHHKALLLSAAFLLEYMYFESSKKKTWLPCCC